MKPISFLSALVISLALGTSARAAEVKLTDVHLCCNNCVKGVEKAVAKVSGATAQSDKDTGTVTLSASDKATVQKAVDALVAAGYFGKSSDASVKVSADSGAKDGKVQSLKVVGLHLCCPKCVSAAQKALATVPGVKANTAEKNAETFEVTGEFNAKDVFTALNKAGLAAKAGK